MVIGQITRAHGVRGAVRVRPTGATLAGLGAGDLISLRTSDGRVHESQIRTLQSRDDGTIVTLDGVDDRDAADALRGAVIVTSPDRLAELPDDEFYVRDMVGCSVRVDGDVLGVVHEVLPGAANDVLDVRPTGGGGAVLVPFTRDAITGIDLRGRVIDVRPGLVTREDA